MSLGHIFYEWTEHARRVYKLRRWVLSNCCGLNFMRRLRNREVRLRDRRQGLYGLCRRKVHECGGEHIVCNLC